MPQIRQFKGLNNVSDPLRLGLAWLHRADNVDITDSGAIVKREGYSLAQAGSFTDVFSTFDFSRMYAVASGTLYAITSDSSRVAIRSGLSTAPMYWAEINEQVYFNNGTDRGVILPDHTVIDLEWPVPSAPTLSAVTGTLPAGTYQVRCSYVLADGRETGTGDSAEITLNGNEAISITDIPQAAASTNLYIAPANSTVYQLAGSTAFTATTWGAGNDALGRDLVNAFLDPLPRNTTSIQFFKGRLYAAQYMPSVDQTVVWFSESLGFHLFNLNSNFILIPGSVRMLAPAKDALLIGTESRVYAYNGTNLELLAPYGVIPGQHHSIDTDTTYFWTTRGLCSALPFKNLTEHQVSVAPGLQAGGCIVRKNGQVRYVVTLHAGGEPFNPHS